MPNIDIHYPGGWNYYPGFVDHTTPVEQGFLNGIGFAFYSIEYTLGLNPQGAFSTVAARFGNFVPKSGGQFSGHVGFNYYRVEYAYLHSIGQLNFAGESVRVKGIKDEDTMSSDSVEHLSTQQSIKAHFDTVHNSRVLVTKNDVQGIAYNSLTIIQYDDVVYDELTEFNAGTYTFTPTKAGYYYISAGAQYTGFTSTSSDRRVEFFLYVNGANKFRLDNQRVMPDGVWDIIHHGSLVLYLPAGATGVVNIRVYQNVRTPGYLTLNTLADATKMWLSIQRVS